MLTKKQKKAENRNKIAKKTRKMNQKKGLHKKKT